MNLNEIEVFLRPYIKHDQGCTYLAVDSDEGEFCSCNRKGRREDIARVMSKMERSKEFYMLRCNALQKAQKEFRDPERTIVCNILANGQPKP